MALSAPQMGTLQVRWDPKNLEIKTKSVEKTLEPLVTQVQFITTLLYYDCLEQNAHVMLLYIVCISVRSVKWKVHHI